MNPEIRQILANTSTASLATLLFKRGLRNQFIQNVSRLGRAKARMVGPVFTLRYIPAREDLNPIEVFQDPGHVQRRAIEEIPENHVLVMDCRTDCLAASAATNLTKHHAIDLNVPIGCGGVAVFPGDIAVGDGDGVIIIPVERANEIAAEARGMEAYENWVIHQVKAGASIIGLYPMNAETRARYEAEIKNRD